MKIVFATGNSGKLKEAREIFQGIEIVSIKEFSSYFDPEEHGKSFLQNAVIKAEAALSVVKKYPVLSDDSGLVVPSLHGAPGIHSARFGGENGNDMLNRERLLKELLGNPGRSAYFICMAVLLFPDYTSLACDGKVWGQIGTEEAGSAGFGYDPLFIPQDFSKTLAQMTPEEKNAISHRGVAFRKLEKRLSCFQDLKE